MATTPSTASAAAAKLKELQGQLDGLNRSIASANAQIEIVKAQIAALNPLATPASSAVTTGDPAKASA